MGHRMDKLMVKISLLDLTIGEMCIMACSLVNHDKEHYQEILRRLSLKDLARFMFWRAGLRDIQVAEVVWDLMEERSACMLEDDLRLGSAILQGRV